MKNHRRFLAEVEALVVLGMGLTASGGPLCTGCHVGGAGLSHPLDPPVSSAWVPLLLVPPTGWVHMRGL